MTTLQDIQTLTRDYADRRQALAGTVDAYHEERTATAKKYAGRIARLALAANRARELLTDAIRDNTALFERPRTQEFHGVKVGLRKGTGKITWADEEQVVKLIKRHFADQADVLIITTEKPNKDALLALDVKDLARIACQAEGTGDVVVVKDAASEVDKLVRALLKEAPVVVDE